MNSAAHTCFVHWQLASFPDALDGGTCPAVLQPLHPTLGSANPDTRRLLASGLDGRTVGPSLEKGRSACLLVLHVGMWRKPNTKGISQSRMLSFLF